ncbi:phage tail fiber protein [Escherichia sp. MOD1-EC6144]|uniref:phage tail fiber protein n=1 Tax=Escherichia sp. MOD1-EC6144 TaxID=2093887 RepID=UPI000CF769A8|nr:phage tail protein [Escherichia sp. MOD1-EC6144]
MHRIDTLTAVKDKFGPGKNGFTDGNLRTGRLATWLNSAMWDAIQEEICGVIEKAGIELNKEEHDQLYKAILLLVGGAINEEALLIKNNLSDVEDKDEAVENLGLKPTVDKAKNAVQRDGDTMSGDLTFENDSILAWIRNTDWAKIGFKNDSDSDTDSYLWFEAGDNGNEYFKWRSKSGTTTKDLMNLKWDALYVLVKALFSSEVKISTLNALRIFNSSFGAIFRRSEDSLHIIPTRENEGENGDIGPLRPFSIDLRTGRITMGHGLNVGGQVVPTDYSNFDARYKTKSEGVQDVRLGGYQQMGSTGSNLAPSGYVSVGGYCHGDWDNSADGWFIRPLQKLINGTWYNVASM